MQMLSLALVLVGLALSLAGSAWLFFGFSPTNPRYVDDGMLYPGQQRSQVVPRLLADQRKPLCMTLAGGSIQVAAGVLALFV